MKKLLAMLAIVAAGAASAQADILYQADFSQFVQIDHDTVGNVLEPSGQVGANFTIGYPTTPSSDTTRNFFETTGASLISSDFGGDHWFLSDTIDVSGWNEVDIDILCDFVGTDSFNNSPTEYIEYVYTLDGGGAQQFFYFTDDPNGSNLNASTTVDVTGFSTMTLGINANADGAGDGWELTSGIVDGTVPVPEPASLALVAFGALVLIRRR